MTVTVFETWRFSHQFLSFSVINRKQDMKYNNGLLLKIFEENNTKYTLLLQTAEDEWNSMKAEGNLWLQKFISVLLFIIIIINCLPMYPQKLRGVKKQGMCGMWLYMININGRFLCRVSYACCWCKVNYRINGCLVLTKIISDFTCSSLKITQQTKEFDAIM